MINVTISGRQIGLGRLRVVARAVEIIKLQNPDIDWDSNDLVLTVVPKADKELKDTG